MAVRSKPRLASRLEKKPRRTISTEPDPQIERGGSFYFSAYVGPIPRGRQAFPSLESVFTNLVRCKSFILHTYEKDGVPLLSQAGAYRFVPTPAAHCTIVLSGARLSLGQAQLWKHLHSF